MTFWEIISLIGFIATLVFGFLTVFFYLKSKKQKSPVYCSRSTCVIKDDASSIDHLKITYDDVALNALSITKVAFWNAGRETISKKDIAPKDKLRIELSEDYVFLSCDVLTQTKEGNNCCPKIEKDGRTITIHFEYLSYQNGFVMRIRHTAPSSKCFKFKGSIKDVDSLKRKRNISSGLSSFRSEKEIKDSFLKIIIVGISSLFICLGLYNVFLRPRIINIGDLALYQNSTLFIILGCLSIILGLLLLYVLSRVIRGVLPKSLNTVYWNSDF